MNEELNGNDISIVSHDDSIEIMGAGIDIDYAAINTRDKLLRFIYYLTGKRFIRIEHLRKIMARWQEVWDVDISSFNPDDYSDSEF